MWRSLRATHCKGNLVPSRSKLHINYLELKVVFLALEECQDLCLNNIVLTANIDEGGMKLGTPCALLWIILTWCSRKQVILKARHIPGQLNVVADKPSRLVQTIQSGFSSQRSSSQYATCGTNLRFVCCKVQQQTGSACVTSSGSPSLGC